MSVKGIVTPAVISALLFTAAGCSLFSEDDTTPPAVPVLISHSPDSLIEEYGIDAVPEADHITLSWLAVQDGDLAGYRLYRYRYYQRLSGRDSTSADSLVLTMSSSADESDTLYWIDESVMVNTIYYYYLRSYDDSDNESNRSRTVSYRLISKVAPQCLDAPRGTVSGSDLVFTVTAPNILAIYQLRIKLYDMNLGRIIWVSRPFNPFTVTHMPFNADSSAIRGITPERHYQWRVDAVGDSDGESGSESQWAEFFALD